MSPEELAEARHYAACYQAGYVHDLMHNFLAHIDQQATRIKELDDAVSGPLENIAKMLETVNADTIFAGVIQTWKNENGTLKTRIAELEATVAALKKIAEEERAYIYSLNVIESMDVDEHMRAEAHRQLAEEHPEAFR